MAMLSLDFSTLERMAAAERGFAVSGEWDVFMCNYLLFIFDTALEESPSEEYLELELELNSINTHTSPGIPLS